MSQLPARIRAPALHEVVMSSIGYVINQIELAVGVMLHNVCNHGLYKTTWTSPPE